MIKEHATNTAWYGERVGAVADAAFFSLDAATQSAKLAEYAWVEFVCPLASQPPLLDLQRAGFAWVDVQIEFKIGLTRIASTPSLAPLEVCFADHESFDLQPNDVMPFEHERFQHIPGMTQAKLDERYVHWAGQWVAENPEWCLQILHENKPQGWFLSKQTDRGLNLTLAMLHRNATISGMHLYHKGLLAYAERGARIGWASFSVTNTSVLNIYGNLGARFLPATGYWLWVRN